MARLPVPGSDSGNWGNILNDFLSVSLNSNGSLKGSAVGATGSTGPQGPTGVGASGAILASTATTKGDLLAATAASTIARFGVGTDGKVLIADSTQTTGLNWTTPSKIFNIADYGAVGDGTTDNQNAIQNAINAAQTAGGGVVYFPTGIYAVSGTPQITGSNIICRGTGDGSQILLATAAQNASGTTIGIWVNGGSNVLIENLSIDGNFTNIARSGTFHGASTLWTPIITKYGANSLKNYTYTGSINAATYLKYRMPIRISNADNVVVQNCLLQNSISAVVLADSTTVNGCSDILVTDCRIKMTWDNAVYFHQGVQYASAVNNIISDITYNGVCAVYSDHILFANNNIRYCGPSDSDSGGVQINGSSNCSVTGNLIDMCQFYGITCESTQETNITNGLGGNQVYSSNVNISSNTITACNANDNPTHTAPGINFFGATDTNVSSNSINNCDKGISLGSQAINTYIVGNRVTNSLSQGIQTGNSSDVINTVIRENFVGWNGSNGIYIYAAARVENNMVYGNTGMGIELATNPTGLQQKIDYVIGNSIFDNTDSGVHANGGSASLAIIERNTFGNSQGKLYMDGVTNGTTTFTSATATFTAADVGLALILINQGTGGVTTAATISAFTNSTTVTLSTAAPGTQTGLTFFIGRGDYFFPDGSTTTAANSVLTSATAGFSSSDAGKSIILLSQDVNPVVLYVGTVNTFTNSTTVTLSTDVGTISACSFIINRSAGQMVRAINNASGQVIDRSNTILGIPEILNGAGTTQLVSSNNLTLERTTIADHTYTTKAQDRTVVFTSLTTARTVTLANANTIGSATLNTPLIIKDEVGTAGTNNITIATTAGQTIDGAATKTINSNYGFLKVYSNGSNWFTTA